MKAGSIGQGVTGALTMALHLSCPFMGGWRRGWGATAAERARALPGDDLVPDPKWSYTRAISINAAADEVWPWIVQMGQGRGGFYTYELLENLVGCKIQNADRIIPELQSLKPGDGIRLHPAATPMPVKEIEPDSYLLLHGKIDPRTGGAVLDDNDAIDDVVVTNWLFYLNQTQPRHTRLIARGLYDYPPTLFNRLMMGKYVLEPVTFVMESRMLQGIKDRVEGRG